MAAGRICAGDATEDVFLVQKAGIVWGGWRRWSASLTRTGA